MMNVTINMPPSGAEGQQYAANSQPSTGHDCTGGGADRGVEFSPDESAVHQPKPAESEDGMMMQLLTMMMEAIIGLLGGGAEKAEASAEPDPAFSNPNTDSAEGMGGEGAEGVNGGDGAMGGPLMQFLNSVMEMLKIFIGGDDKGAVSAEPDSAFSNPATDSGLGMEGDGAEGVNGGDGALPGPLMQLVNTLMEMLKLLLGGDDKGEAGFTENGDTNYAANYETEAANMARNTENGGPMSNADEERLGAEAGAAHTNYVNSTNEGPMSNADGAGGESDSAAFVGGLRNITGAEVTGGEAGLTKNGDANDAVNYATEAANTVRNAENDDANYAVNFATEAANAVRNAENDDADDAVNFATEAANAVRNADNGDIPAAQDG